MSAFLTRAELMVGLTDILASPKTEGLLEAIVMRPGPEGERKELDCCPLSLEFGVLGDKWISESHRLLDNGQSHPDVQICMMNSRCIGLIARTRENWSAVGDNLYIDLDLSPDNLHSGCKLAIGSAVLQITDEPHFACASFVTRYGREAAAFVNTGIGRKLQLRGIYGRVVQDGMVTVGDKVQRLG